jgi:glycerol-3-phosphate O-acyltransferase
MVEDALTQQSDPSIANATREEFGAFGRLIAHRYFEQVRFPQSGTDELKRLHQSGYVVHVMRSTSWINYLYLTWALIRRGLPPIRAVVNLRRWFTRPWSRTAQRGDFNVRITYARRHSGSALVFLKESALGRASGRDSSEDPFPALVELARKSDRPIYLVPELFVWEKWNQKIAPGLFDRIFGSPEVPGFLHSLGAFLRNYHRAQFRIGEPIDLKAFVEQNPNNSDAVIARKVKSSLHHHLARETRAVFGPPAKPTTRLLDEAMRDRVFRASLEEIATERQRPIESVQREARRNLDQIAARFMPSVVAIAEPILNWVFNRIYDGIEVDEVGLDRMMKAAAHSAIVITPSHKSHIDYLVMSHVLWKRGYTVPLVAAGGNLSFFPLGPFLRRAGAYFLRRSFKGDKVYTAAFKAYLKKLVHDGIHNEFFPEGGRSRTGKLLQPKLGMFTWLVDAVLEGARDDLLFVPVAIDYEKVVEGGSYSAELKGGEKKAEDLSALLAAPKVLAENYGRIHLSFDEPVSLAAMIKERRIDRDRVSDEQKKGLVRALGHRVMYGIGRVSTLTPHALLAASLLAHRRRGVLAREVTDRIVLLRKLAEDLRAPLSRHLVDAPSSPTSLGPVADALKTFINEGMLKSAEAKGEPVYQLDDDKRSELSFYKNTLLNLVAGRTIVACALLADESNREVSAISERAQFLSRLFKFEFVFPVGKSFLQIFDETVDHLVKLGLVVRESTALKVAPEPFARPQLEFLSDLIRDYLESYLLAALTVAETSGPIEKKELIKQALETGRAEFLAGRITTAESLSRTTLETAVMWLLDQQAVIEKDKKLTAGPKPLADLAERIRSYL